MKLEIDEKEVDALWVFLNQSTKDMKEFYMTTNIDNDKITTPKDELTVLHRIWDLMDKHIVKRSEPSWN